MEALKRNQWVEMAKDDPEKAIAAIEADEPGRVDVTFMLEKMGQSPNTQVVLPFLLKRIKDGNRVNVEGAVYGIDAHFWNHGEHIPESMKEETLRELRRVYMMTPSDGVKAAIKDTLSTIEDE